MVQTTTLVSGKRYVITFDGLVFIGLYVTTDTVHHFEDVYGLSDKPEEVTFSTKCTFYGPIEEDVEMHTILQSIKDLL